MQFLIAFQKNQLRRIESSTVTGEVRGAGDPAPHT
jgi:hypothetical protein